MKYFYSFLLPVLLVFNAHSIELVIPRVEQETNYTCWAACCEMLFRAYENLYVTQEEIALAYGVGEDKWNTLNGTTTALEEYEPYIMSIMYTRPGSMDEIQDEIDGTDASVGRVPILAEWDITSADQHMVLIIGYTGNDVIYIDPEDITIPIHKSFEKFKNEPGDHTWKNFARLVSRPPKPIPTGIGPHEYLAIREATTSITQFPQSLSYTAYRSGNYAPVTWKWRLIFPHTEGDCVAASWTVNSSNRTSVWNIPSFSLPENYQWKYNNQGHVPGRVEVVVDDDGGPPALDAAKDVVVIPSSPYPGIVEYYQKTISSSQSQVKAHEMITLWDDQFNSGANMNFTSGEQIVLEDGVTIKSGSTVTFTVDPSIR